MYPYRPLRGKEVQYRLKLRLRTYVIHVSQLIIKCIYLISWLSFECSQEKSCKWDTTQPQGCHNSTNNKKRKTRKPKKTIQTEKYQENRTNQKKKGKLRKNYEKPKRTKRKPAKNLRNP